MRLVRALLFALMPLCAQAQTPPVIVGAALPQTGDLADLASGYRNGLLLWQQEVNAAGGLLGRHVELRLFDDRSEANRDGPLYAKLVSEDKADVLFGPFGSAATIGASAVAERNRRVLLDATGATLSVLGSAQRYVFHVAAPYAAYGETLLGLLRASGYTKLYVLARDDPASREMAQRFVARAARYGLATGPATMYPGAVPDFTPQLTAARASGAEALIAFGGEPDAAEMVKTMWRMKYAPKLFFARGAADARFVRDVGQDAEFTLSVVPYQPDFGTEGNALFVKAYAERWSAPPDLAAAQAYAAGQVLEQAVRHAGSLEQEKLAAALAALEGETVLGRYRIDPSTREQLGATPVVVQILRGRPQVVWPRERATAHWRLPYPRWDERKPIE
ncbi:MAG: amino acid ABC transporter substrate-binding protein [Sphingomonadaceae bacterium]